MVCATSTVSSISEALTEVTFTMCAVCCLPSAAAPDTRLGLYLLMHTPSLRFFLFLVDARTLPFSLFLVDAFDLPGKLHVGQRPSTDTVRNSAQ